MDYDRLLDGNGQEIYIDIDSLYIKPEWVNNVSHSITFPNIPIEESNPVYETCKEMFKVFYEKGYKIITDSRLVNDNTFFFTPCLDKHINKTKDDYKNKKDLKIKSSLNECGIFEPTSIRFPKDKFPSNLPELPLVLKNEESQGGTEKFIIRTKGQLEKVKKFYNEINSYDRQQRINMIREYYDDPTVEVDENGRSNRGLSVVFIDYKKEFNKNLIFQKYINTPTSYNTSLRVLFSSSGDIMVSSLKYSETIIKDNNKKYYGLFDKYLANSESPFFIGNESIVSNTVAGGNSILLGKEEYSNEEKRILLAHGINPSEAVVPEEIVKACNNVANNCSREIGAICGMDFIYDVNEHKWKYLEEHEYPMLYSYCEKYNIPYNVNEEDFYKVNMLIDIRARFDSLVLTMNKKYINKKTKRF